MPETRPLSARSLVASTLLGTHPPELAGRLLVALGERFGIVEGTTRVALSRMVDKGELENDDAHYRLAGDLLARQERQDRSRAGDDTGWDGTWELAVVTATGRSARSRAETRRAFVALSMAEMREGVWTRPANLNPDRLPVMRESLTDADWMAAKPENPARLAAELWDLERWDADARELQRMMRAARGESAGDAVVEGFTLSAAVLRQFVRDPQLPRALWPLDWPAADLRHDYDSFDAHVRDVLRAFFRDQIA